MWMMKSASSKLNQLTLHTAAFKHCGIFLPNAIKYTPPNGAILIKMILHMRNSEIDSARCCTLYHKTKTLKI